MLGCDSFVPYYDPRLKRSRAHLLQQEAIRVAEIDIRDATSIETLLREERITHLVHLAAQAGVRHSMVHPESFVQSNVEGFVQIMEVCRRLPHILLTYASSSSVYGLNRKIPFSESDSADHPVSFYGATKRAGELIAHSYHHLYGIRATGLRFFTAYGPWGRPDMAYFLFTKAILEGRPIQLFNHGQMQRDFTYIEDIVQGTVASIDLGANWEIFNIGGSAPENVLHLIHLIETYTGKQAKVEFLDQQPGELLLTCADIEKSKTLLGYTPSTRLDEGMRQFVEWYCQYYASHA